MESPVRIDKWLWSVRLFKTRSQATEACRSGKVRVGGDPVKPSREVHEGNTIEVSVAGITRTVKVTGLIGNRVSASLAVQHYEDLTPREEYDKLKIKKEQDHEFRPRGLGRPTKKERRLIDQLKKKKHF